MHILYQADFRHNFFTLKTPQNIYLSWRKNRTESHFSKPTSTCKDPTAANHIMCVVTPKYIQPLSSLHQIANFSLGRDMIFQ
jgi:hypothetical protein